RQPAPALDSARLRPRLRGPLRIRRGALQDHGLLVSGARALAALERPGAGHRLGGGGTDAVGQGQGREGAGGGGELRLTGAGARRRRADALRRSFRGARAFAIWSTDGPVLDSPVIFLS